MLRTQHLASLENAPIKSILYFWEVVFFSNIFHILNILFGKEHIKAFLENIWFLRDN